jgi:hypothetical protein
MTTRRGVSSPHFHIDEEARSQPNAHPARGSTIINITLVALARRLPLFLFSPPPRQLARKL